jgi:hypothetical protein
VALLHIVHILYDSKLGAGMFKDPSEFPSDHMGFFEQGIYSKNLYGRVAFFNPPPLFSTST